MTMHWSHPTEHVPACMVAQTWRPPGAAVCRATDVVADVDCPECKTETVRHTISAYHGAQPRRHGLEFTREQYPDLAEAIGARPEFVQPFRLSDIRVSREDVEGPVLPDPRSVIAAAARAAATVYNPTTLILHPIDHARAGIDPDRPETIESAKRVADSFGVPYWQMGIPGYRAPLPVRIRGRWRRAVRAVRDSPGRLPGVRRYYDPYDGWGDRTPSRRGPLWVRVGRWQIGHVCEDD